MMIDSRGRVFGRVNIVDALLVLFLLALVPVGYATYLLFRPAAPTIDSVERVEVSREERRIAGGNVVLAKLKVRGTGLSPMLRAALGTTPAIGFVFENPNSADVIVGELPPGTFDLVLLDGVQEVARAANAITVEAAPVQRIRASGYLIDLTRKFAEDLRAGDAHPANDARVRILHLGPVQASHTRFDVGPRVTEVVNAQRFERAAVVMLTCDGRATDDVCTVGGMPLTGNNPVVALPLGAGAVRFVPSEIFPDGPPHRFDVVIRVSAGAEGRHIAVDDRDGLLDERAAVVTRIGPATTGGFEVALSLGADSSRDGWHYRGQRVQPGAELTLHLPRVVVHGTIQSAVEASR